MKLTVLFLKRTWHHSYFTKSREVTQNRKYWLAKLRMMVHRFALNGKDEMVNVLAFESELEGVLTGTILTSKWGKDKSCSHRDISNLKSG